MWSFNHDHYTLQFSYLYNKDDTIAPAFWGPDEGICVGGLLTVIGSPWSAMEVPRVILNLEKILIHFK